MLDVNAEFARFCGPSVLYSSHDRQGRTLTVIYTIPAISNDMHKVVAHLSNGIEITLIRAVRRCAATASHLAYRLTGHRDDDMKRLLQGRLV